MQEETGANEASVETAEASASAVEIQETPQHASSSETDESAPIASSPTIETPTEGAPVEDAPAVTEPTVATESTPVSGSEASSLDSTSGAAEPTNAAAADVLNADVLNADVLVPDVLTADVATANTSDAVTADVVADPVPVTPDSGLSGSDPSVSETTEATSTETAVEPAVVIVFTYQPGDIVPGIITVIGPNGIEADLGEDELAVIPKAELVDGHDPVIGEQIEGTVIRHQAGSGRYVISPKRAHRTRSWTRIEAAFEAGEPITGVVKATTKGGLILDLGMRAFLPESLIDVRKVHDVAALVGTTMTVKIIECEKITGEQAATERRSEKIVVNRRVMLEVERQAQREAMFSSVHVGDKRTGTVTALTDFGAFVDIGGGEGLIHVSELAHRQVAKPSDVVKVGDTVEVVVLDVKPERNKISLSRKALLPSPWDQFSLLHKAGDLVFGTVTGLASFGVFVTIEGEGFEPVEGLVHISELSRFRVEQASDVVAVGEGVWSQILSIDPDKRRVALSMRRALE